MAAAREYQVGDPVVYRKTKRSAHPGPRAEMVDAAPRGEDYVYEVDKYWVVAGHTDEGMLILRTRRGKQHIVGPDDPKLRPATFAERLFKGWRFPRITNDG